jgi:hypothetical protein
MIAIANQKSTCIGGTLRRTPASGVLCGVAGSLQPPRTDSDHRSRQAGSPRRNERCLSCLNSLSNDCAQPCGRCPDNVFGLRSFSGLQRACQSWEYQLGSGIRRCGAELAGARTDRWLKPLSHVEADSTMSILLTLWEGSNRWHQINKARSPLLILGYV